jgi:DNA-binding SARP family transcriptional activator
MHQIRILTLGEFEAVIPSRSGSTPIRFPSRKSAAVIAFLALQRSGRASRDTLAQMLWNGVPLPQARHSLRQTLLEIRRAYVAATGDYAGDRLLTTVGDDVALRTSRVFIDIHMFKRCVDRGTTRALSVACALYRGEFLSGMHTREPAFDVWVANQRNRHHMLAVDAHERCIESLMQRDRVESALNTALRLLELDPFHEPAHRAVMAAYARRGDITAAKRHYDALSSLLRDELNIDPAPETRNLLQAILRDRGMRSWVSRAVVAMVPLAMSAFSS